MVGILPPDNGWWVGEYSLLADNRCKDSGEKSSWYPQVPEANIASHSQFRKQGGGPQVWSQAARSQEKKILLQMGSVVLNPKKSPLPLHSGEESIASVKFQI